MVGFEYDWGWSQTNAVETAMRLEPENHSYLENSAWSEFADEKINRALSSHWVTAAEKRFAELLDGSGR